jgi:hypothetical protein
MRVKVCEVDGCRKHVKNMAAVRVLFCTQVGPHGDVPIYRERHLFRCTAHALKEGGSVLKVLSIAEYDALVAAAVAKAA